MSVPLPSPSSLSPAKPILRSRPQPITPYSPQQHSPSSPRRSVGFSPANEDNWRDRNGGLGHRSVGRSGPERTVGGFEKREVRSGSGSGSTLSAGLGMGSAKDKMKEREDGEAKSEWTSCLVRDHTDGDRMIAAALSRVPCRFFKAGACTAGSSCPFSHEEGMFRFSRCISRKTNWLVRREEGSLPMVSEGQLQVRTQMCPRTRSTWRAHVHGQEEQEGSSTRIARAR